MTNEEFIRGLCDAFHAEFTSPAANGAYIDAVEGLSPEEVQALWDALVTECGYMPTVAEVWRFRKGMGEPAKRNMPNAMPGGCDQCQGCGALRVAARVRMEGRHRFAEVISVEPYLGAERPKEGYEIPYRCPCGAHAESWRGFPLWKGEVRLREPQGFAERQETVTIP